MEKYIVNKKDNSKRNNKVNPEKVLTNLSKTMSYLLRHQATEHGLLIESSGFVNLNDLLKCQPMKKAKATQELVFKVVETDKKGRYELENRPPWYIRAVQGHSIKLVKDEDILDPITNICEYPIVIHGTYFEAWDKIKDTGLNRMARNSIHFSIGHKKDDHVISGMRMDCQVFIELNSIHAFYSGIKFFVSKNKVVLSPGIDGVIPPKYFKIVTDQNGKTLYSQKYEIAIVLDIFSTSEDQFIGNYHIVHLISNKIILSGKFDKFEDLNNISLNYLNTEFIMNPFIVLINKTKKKKFEELIKSKSNLLVHLAFYTEYVPVEFSWENLKEEELLKENFLSVQGVELLNAVNRNRIDIDFQKWFDQTYNEKVEDEQIKEIGDNNNNLSSSINSNTIANSEFRLTKEIISDNKIEKNYLMIFLNFEEDDILTSIEYIIIPQGKIECCKNYKFLLESKPIKGNLISFLEELKSNLQAENVFHKMLILCMVREDLDYVKKLMKKNLIKYPKLFRGNVILLNPKHFEFLAQGENSQAAEIFVLQYIIDEKAIEKIKILI